MPGELVYFVMPAGDAEQAQEFYGGLLGWTFSPGNVPGGFNIEGSSPPGGLVGGGDAPARLYFQIDDIEEGAARVRELGGKAGDAQQTEGGRYVDCEDDQGAPFGIWAPDPQ